MQLSEDFNFNKVANQKRPGLDINLYIVEATLKRDYHIDNITDMVKNRYNIPECGNVITLQGPEALKLKHKICKNPEHSR